MVAKDRTAFPPERERELRRSGRFALIIPVRVKWKTDESSVFREEAEAIEVNAHGAMLRMKERPKIGTQIELTNCISDEVALARVVSIGRSKPDTVAVELLVPSESYWGVTFKLKRATDDLRRLEQEIRSGLADPRVLREFREAIDYVRKTAWAVNEWQERQVKHKDTSTVLTLLTTERIRRATQLTDAILADMDANRVTSESSGVADLLRALRQLDQRLGTPSVKENNY